jgi:hypothetical protein
MDPKSKLLLTIDVGERTLAMAQCVVHQVALLLASDGVPLYGWIQGLLHCHPHPCPTPKPRWMPRPGLLYD